MKKTVLLLVISYLFFVFTLPVFAQESSSAVTPTPTPSSYQLPYPGILPGHPFYFLRVVRDSLNGFFITDTLKKADFDLHQTDKQVAAAQYLLNKKQPTSVVVSTLLSAENYFSDALKKAEEARKQGMDAKDLMKRLRVANLKHQEVVADLVGKSSGNDKKLLQFELEKFEEFAKKIK